MKILNKTYIVLLILLMITSYILYFVYSVSAAEIGPKNISDVVEGNMVAEEIFYTYTIEESKEASFLGKIQLTNVASHRIDEVRVVLSFNSIEHISEFCVQTVNQQDALWELAGNTFVVVIRNVLEPGESIPISITYKIATIIEKNEAQLQAVLPLPVLEIPNRNMAEIRLNIGQKYVHDVYPRSPAITEGTIEGKILSWTMSTPPSLLNVTYSNVPMSASSRLPMYITYFIMFAGLFVSIYLVFKSIRKSKSS
jgi:hypothetical protein